jgi:hypothetical protein
LAFEGVHTASDNLYSPQRTFDAFDSDDEDLFSSPPSSPTFSDCSLFDSPPPSPTFDSSPTFLPPLTFEDAEVDVPHYSPSSAYHRKLASLDAWLSSSSADLAPVGSPAFFAVLAHGVAFIDSEEALEREYDAHRGSAKKPVSIHLRDDKPRSFGGAEKDDVRAQRSEQRIKDEMESFLASTSPSICPPSPITLSRSKQQQLSVCSRNRGALLTTSTHLNSSSSVEPQFVALPALRRYLNPTQTRSPARRTRTPSSDVRSTLLKQSHRDSHLNEFDFVFGLHAELKCPDSFFGSLEQERLFDEELELDGETSVWSDEDDDEFDFFSSSSSSASSSFDEDDDERSLFDILPPFSIVDDLFSTAVDLASPTLSPFVAPKPSSSSWSDLLEAASSEYSLLSSTPRWDDLLHVANMEYSLLTTLPSFAYGE